MRRVLHAMFGCTRGSWSKEKSLWIRRCRFCGSVMELNLKGPHV